ncbi:MULTISPECIES: ADP-ribosylglycohydrolase family protein [Clostridium]|uniref:ADP-ribosyl-[dinitrogen reductase] glycohydrolase n=1 Tax=Clostridium ragsdalei P11 TaxID=1353534 RepID=A0A1A6AHV0_9CLOT|nr:MULTISPECIES: ADP-ribosylglycohydrolase family protein [Clostridium]OBR89644.1 ADP-ribosyl-[dinitrogen reductase] glycohydrolase [Clostridium ragsdalei P11]QXE21091.1 ADP-ribosyl-[dinitrogen reductase] hydrolase [Clostridium sp. 001]
MKRLNKLLGGLFGVACGDALGATLEFLSQEEGRKTYGYLKDIIGRGHWKLKPGQVTDDTMMTLCVAGGILENPECPIESIGNRFVKWYNSDPKDIGMTCELAIKKYIETGNWKEASFYVHHISNGRTAGNGTIMRCIPVALYYRDYSKMIDITRLQSKMTHYDEKAADACVIYNTVIYKYLNGETKERAITETIYSSEDYKDVMNMKKEELIPSGYVVDTLRCALWCFMNNSNLGDTVCEAANLCGDADTVAAVAGGLAGTYYGYDSIPERWKNKIEVKDKLMSIGEKINSTHN